MKAFVLIISLFLMVTSIIKHYTIDSSPICGRSSALYKKQPISLKKRAPLTHYAVWWYINYRQTKYPYIVYKQAICESSLSSPIAISNHNILGLRLPISRPILALCEQDGYAVYANWQQCVDDYLLLQKLFSGHSEEDYYLFLAHYGDSCYVKNLKNARVPIPTEKLTFK